MKIRHRIKKLMVDIGLYPHLFRIRERYFAFRAQTPPAAGDEGIPLPPPYLMSVIVANADWRTFLESGKNIIDYYASILQRNQANLSEFKAVLDLGCGCGRLIRHLSKYKSVHLFGCDYNEELIKWCSSHLQFGEFRLNQLLPPTPYENEKFDWVYLNSVFTHLEQTTQEMWLSEIQRILAPGGYALITFHDESYISKFQYPEVTAQEFAKCGFAIENQVCEGSNLMATFQSRAQVRESFSKYFEILEIVPGHTSSALKQAVVLCRKWTS